MPVFGCICVVIWVLYQVGGVLGCDCRCRLKQREGVCVFFSWWKVLKRNMKSTTSETQGKFGALYYHYSDEHRDV